MAQTVKAMCEGTKGISIYIGGIRVTKYYSQTGEDYLLCKIFKQKKRGFFIDVGAFDGIYLSNSYSFELAGWTGLCVEAHPFFFTRCQKNRPNSHCVNAACLDNSLTQTITFYAEKTGLLSGVEQSREDDVKNLYDACSLKFAGFEELVVPVTTLNESLENLDSVPEIDFVSIDVEGSELKVLQGFDLNKYRPRILVVEANDRQAELDLDRYLTGAGYLKARKVGCNLFYCRDKKDKRVISWTLLKCRLEPTVHPLGDKYTLPRLKIEPQPIVALKNKIKRLIKTVSSRYKSFF